VLFQPGHQRQVIGQAAKQGHGGVPVGVDQARGEQRVGQFADFRGAILQGLGAWADEHDVPVADAQAVFPEDDAGRLHRHQPGREQQQVERNVAVRHRVSVQGFI